MLSHALQHLPMLGRSLRESGFDLPQPNGDDVQIELPPFYMGLLAITGLVFFICLALFEYAYFNVFMTLCMVENPTTTIILHGEANQPLNAQEPIQPSDEEVVAVQNPPITSSIRGLRRHLRATCGRFASFRGLGLSMIIALTISIVSQIFMIPFSRLGSFVAVPVAAILASLLVARWQMAWTHIIISEPSTLTWWRRVPPMNTWSKILPATATYAVARQINLGILVVGVTVLVSSTPEPADNSNKAIMHTIVILLAKALGFLALIFVSVVTLVVPSAVALVRTHASLLPETVETIVPVDRSFGGKVVPAVLGGTGCLKLRDALSSVNRATILRIVKMFLKGALLEFAFILIAMFCFAIEGAFISKHVIIHDGKDDPVF